MGRAANLTLAALLCSTAQPSAAREWPETAGWVIFEGGHRCGMEQKLPREGPRAAVSLEVDGPALLLLHNPSAGPARKQATTVDLFLDRNRFPGVKAFGTQPSALVKGFGADVDEDFLAAFARAREMRVIWQGREVMRVDLAGSAAALAKVRECMTALPPVPRAPPPPSVPAPPAPPAPPRPAPSPAVQLPGYVSEDDYPLLAVRDGAEGTTAVRLLISPAGQVTDCAVTASSGHVELDFRTCVLMEDRFRYLPALDASGRPIAAELHRRIRWTLPPEPEPPTPPPDP